MNETKQLRQRLGLTQEAFAIRLGISVMTVRRWESGKTKPSRMALTLLKELEKAPQQLGDKTGSESRLRRLSSLPYKKQ